jgi:hypothetical protein
MAASSTAKTLLSRGQAPTVTEISLQQLEVSTIEALITEQEAVIVNLNDLGPTTDVQFQNLIRPIIKHRKLCTFGIRGYEADLRPICEIPEAKDLFKLAATKYGVLGLIINKITLGILPVPIPDREQYLQQEIDEYVACCIGTYEYQVSLGKSAFSIDLDQK